MACECQPFINSQPSAIRHRPRTACCWPLVPPGKKLLLWTATGDYSQGAPFAQYDLLTPTIATVFGFIGVTDFSLLTCGSRGESPELAEAALKGCHEGIDKLSPVW